MGQVLLLLDSLVVELHLEPDGLLGLLWTPAVSRTWASLDFLLEDALALLSSSLALLAGCEVLVALDLEVLLLGCFLGFLLQAFSELTKASHWVVFVLSVLLGPRFFLFELAVRLLPLQEVSIVACEHLVRLFGDQVVVATAVV
jgi:hypothetical protein